jgi:hypothetical protein
MNKLSQFPLLCLVFLTAVTGCDGLTQPPPRFALLTPEQTGITFANTITTDDSVNVQMDSFVYNGGGVAVGDIDNDGLADIYLTGNMVSSRLYLNRGGMWFEDITESAGVGTDGWAYAPSLVDIDADGYLDIYVAVSGPEWSAPEDRANLLFLNNGDRTFREAAAAYGLDDTGFSTQGAFFDHDGDGDLDLFLLTNDPGGFSRGDAQMHPAGVQGKSELSFDRLYRNDGEGTFTNVSDEAGIVRQIGFGLGVAVTDLNRDGWPDIYVSNDDTPNDVLYRNNGDGTFTNVAASWLKHTVVAGMGVDVADVDNDGWYDIVQTDMVAEDLTERKRMTGAMTYGSFMELRRRGFLYDYSANALQLNAGPTDDGGVVFSEIAHFAGLPYTSWTWSPLFVDLDNDGLKDIHITNGYPKAVIDYDYQTRAFGMQRAGDYAGARGLLDSLHSYNASNYVFRNEGDLTFSNQTAAWGLERPSFSYGAAYADLDRDGRLDLVVNNIDAPAYVYHNAPADDDAHHYLQVQLVGEAPNTRGLGATVIVRAGGLRQYVYHNPYRGYQSSMDDWLHFGLAQSDAVDSVLVVWRDGRSQVLTDLPVDTVVTARQVDATEDAGAPPSEQPRGPFRPMDAELAPKYEHDPGSFVDFRAQPLLPHMISRHGPPLAVGDVNGDGFDDLFVGGGAGTAGTLFTQRADGAFIASTNPQPWTADREYEDWGALFFDANADDRLDLYVTSGGYHLSPVSSRLQDRLYVNRGDGRFERDAAALPAMPTSTARVVAGDVTGDGLPDLFVAGRLLPRGYPYPTRSYVLRNDGGRFTDVTETMVPELVQPGGMVTDAVWVDFTGDDRLDLITAGTWMPVQFYANDGERLRPVRGAVSPSATRGWWYSLATGDFNEDGLPDVVAGNVGLNHTFTTSEASQFGVYANSFTGSQTTDVVFTQEIDGTEYPFFGLAKLGSSIYTVGIQFPSYQSFAAASIRQVFTAAQLEQAVHYQADTFASMYLQNDGDGTFTATPLPNPAQISPVNGIIVRDIDRDGHDDLIVAGNQYHTEPNVARIDAGMGLWLRGDGQGGFDPVPPHASGFRAPGHVTGLALANTPAGTVVLVANDGDSLQTFLIEEP